MKKAGAISLLLLLFYTQWGYYAQFVLLQWRMKAAAREAWIAALPDSAFLRISLAEVNANGKWEEAGKECWYRGHLYDVIRQRATGHDISLFCLDDKREARLVRQSGEVTKASQDHPGGKTTHSLSFTIGDLVCEGRTWDIRSLPPALPPHGSGRCWRLPVRYAEIVLPPPKG